MINKHAGKWLNLKHVLFMNVVSIDGGKTWEIRAHFKEEETSFAVGFKDSKSACAALKNYIKESKK